MTLTELADGTGGQMTDAERLRELAAWFRDMESDKDSAAFLEAIANELQRMEEALFAPPENDASYNLQGALEDIKTFDPQDGGVIARTISRVIDQLEQARAALKD